MLNSGIPEGTSASTTLPEDAWDLLGLGASDALNDRDLHIKNGQVCLLTGGDYVNAKRRYALENREAHRAQWRQQAEQRMTKAGMQCKPMPVFPFVCFAVLPPCHLYKKSCSRHPHEGAWRRLPQNLA